MPGLAPGIPVFILNIAIAWLEGSCPAGGNLQTLCETFRWQAGVVWNRTIRATDLKLFMSEETTTEMALYEIARWRQTGDYTATPAIAVKEANKAL